MVREARFEKRSLSAKIPIHKSAKISIHKKGRVSYARGLLKQWFVSDKPNCESRVYV
jgi:hypothetical protein